VPPHLRTSHSLTVQPAALKANGMQRRTPTTGPECPVRVTKGLSADPGVVGCSVHNFTERSSDPDSILSPFL